MAESPAHRFGQIVGNLVQSLLIPKLEAFCLARRLYLDKQGIRGRARAGKKVTWTDRYGNEHDLDFVIEKGGSADTRGRPVAFIEVAWRRYTKHSRNKAQEIQGAIGPIAEQYSWEAPFLGAVVAGLFTEGSLTQLKSLGFKVLYIPYETIVNAFGDVGIDVRFDEGTPDAAFATCIDAIDRLSQGQRSQLHNGLLARNQAAVASFLTKLESTLDRMIDFIAIIPLYGAERRFATLDEAFAFLSGDPGPASGELHKFEVVVRYTSGDAINGSFGTREKAIAFLRHLAS